ncbi:MAG: hypothetical protein HGN29_17740 [Asgard group archaeon]|nr:hypothetical protein [Asgard group archaeon]
MSNQRKIIYRNQKRKVGIEYTIYSDETIIGETVSITSSGIRIPQEIGKYFHLPTEQDERIEIIVDIKVCSSIEDSVFENIASEIYLQKIAYPDRKKRKVLRDVVFLKPKEPSILKSIRFLAKHQSRIRYIIHKQLDPSAYFLNVKSLRDLTPIDFDITSLELIVTGGLQSARFEIYRDYTNQLFIRMDTSIRGYGKVTLSSELDYHLASFFDYDFFVCKKESEQPMVIPTLPREIDQRKVMEISFPHMAKKKKDTTIIFTHPNLTLRPSTITDYQKKCLLKEMGFPIKSYHSNYITGQHKEPEVEEAMRKLIQKTFSTSKQLRNSEVQLVIDSPHENEVGNKHTFDEIIIDERDNSLLIIEYKTSFTQNKYGEVDKAIAELEHFRRKLGGKVFLVLLMDDDLFNSKREIITQQFGERNNILLIGKHDLEVFYLHPELLLERINSFKQRKETIKKIPFKKETQLYKSLLKLSESQVINKHTDFLLKKLPLNYRVISILNGLHSGADFEQQVQALLMNEGFAVLSNVLIGYYSRKMEIDHFGFKNDTLTIISCRDASNVSCLMSLKLDIKQKACLLEHRKFLLNADYARLYLKVSQKVYNKVKHFESTWIDSVEIVFVVD